MSVDQGICFASGLAINWEALEAVGTVCATGVAALAAYLAVRSPQDQRMRDRSEGTAEILKASLTARSLFEEARTAAAKTGSWDDTLAANSAKAASVRISLDRLIARPELTDGAIASGAAAMCLLDAIAAGRDIGKAHDFFGRMDRIAAELEGSVEVVQVLNDRAQRVAAYAVKRKWPRYRDRFQQIADCGL